MLRTEKLTKTYEAFRLGPLDLEVQAGETVALLGKNGAGKTTLFQILTGNLDASAGEVRLGGKKLTPDTPVVKRDVGYLPQNPVLPRWVSGREVLLYAAKLYQLPDAQAHVAKREAYWDCAEYRDKPLAALSYGMQKRLGLALATLRDPPLVILDEPFSGLDLFHIKALDDAIEARAKAGLTTIVSTHDAANAAKLCHRALIIESGAVRALPGWEPAGFVDRISLIENAFFGVSR
jgi:ABC-type multidrug transport system ATPase subunit